jgi:hypothetical protein
MKKSTGGTAQIRSGWHCRDCGWPIIDACCNDSFNDFKDAEEWDWWMYCSNKGCANHEGTGVFQVWPNWIEEDEKNATEEKNDMCPTCGNNPATEPHACPYKSEINGNEEECTCCPDCEHECAMDV